MGMNSQQKKKPRHPDHLLLARELAWIAAALFYQLGTEWLTVRAVFSRPCVDPVGSGLPSARAFIFQPRANRAFATSFAKTRSR